MKLGISIFCLFLIAAGASAQEKLNFQVINNSPYARIEAAPLKMNPKNRAYTLSFVVANTGEKTIRKIGLRYKCGGQIKGYQVNMDIMDLDRKILILPKKKGSIVLAENAPFSRSLNDMTSGSVSIRRIEFADGTVWENPNDKTSETDDTERSNH